MLTKFRVQTWLGEMCDETYLDTRTRIYNCYLTAVELRFYFFRLCFAELLLLQDYI